MKQLIDIQNQIAQANYKEDWRQLEYYQRENLEEDVCGDYAMYFLSYIFVQGFEFDYIKSKWINHKVGFNQTWTTLELLDLYKKGVQIV